MEAVFPNSKIKATDAALFLFIKGTLMLKLKLKADPVNKNFKMSTRR